MSDLSRVFRGSGETPPTPSDLRCHCIEVFFDAVSFRLKERFLLHEHCMTEDGHAVARYILIAAAFRKKMRHSVAHISYLLVPSPGIACISFANSSR